VNGLTEPDGTPTRRCRPEAAGTEVCTPSLSVILFKIKAARIEKACAALKRADDNTPRGVRVASRRTRQHLRIAAARERNSTDRMEAFERASMWAEVTLDAEQGRLYPPLAKSRDAAQLRKFMGLPQREAQQARRASRPRTRPPLPAPCPRRRGQHHRGGSRKTSTRSRSSDGDDGAGEPADGSSHAAQCRLLAQHIEQVSTPFSFSYGELRIHLERTGLTADRPTAQRVLRLLPADFWKGAEIERWREIEDRRLEREWAVRS
jgi:hypothetical protein